VLALANAVEARDSYTGRHAQRVAAYGLRVADAAEFDVDPQVEFGFLLHDIGKVGVPDAILFKPGPLDDHERVLVRAHPEIGSDILRHIEFLDDAKSVVRHHHERWDGHGYPDGLSGDAIPKSARVFAVADALDALTSERPYRPAIGFASAREVIRAEAGSHFDPEIVAAYDTVPDDAFVRIRDGLG
jgi:ribonuclease P protein subunit RPR2